jgi:winged helix DNA-binding protein
VSSPRFDAAERRRRLLARHRLAAASSAPSVAEAAAAMVGLHSSDPTTVVLSARARVRDLTVADVERALYERRDVLRILGMRRTLFVVPPDLAVIIRAACSEPIARVERRRLMGFLETARPDRDAAALLAQAEVDTLAALDDLGAASATELTSRVPALGEQFAFGEGKRYAGTFGLSTRLLFLLAAEWKVIRARPRGSWVSGQYRWARLEAWAPDLPPIPTPETARRLLVERWLSAFGPGTERDLAWWTGLPLGQLRAALSGLDLATVRLDDEDGLALATDLEPTRAVAPSATLLPSLDPTPMGWKLRDWFLGPHGTAVFDTNGNIGPSVWWDGRLVGGWGQRPDGTVVIRLLEDVGREGTDACAAAAAELGAWLAGVRISPRFPTPLQRMLAS